MSLFSTMEFSQQPENYLDEMFGLSADILAADIDNDGSILDLGIDGVTKHHQSGQESLEDLLMQGPVRDSFGEDWMETVDFKTLLDSNMVAVSQPAQVPQQPTPAIKFELGEARKEGMKVAAFELLKALLTANQDVKLESNLSVPVTTPPVTSPAVEVPNIEFPIVSSPISEPPALDFSSTISDFDILLGDTYQEQDNSFEDYSEMQPVLSLDNSEMDTANEGPLIASIELLDTISHPVDSGSNFQDISSPSSCDEDAMSFLSSGPSSPSLSTIDSSHFSDESIQSSVKSSQVSEQDFTKMKTKSKKSKSRSSPYDPDYDVVTNKKQRKKVQNKNAATRYRVKKRMEKETLQEQEVRLSDNNKELREKVDSLAREIKYMKELMNEINKAKQRKI